MAIVMQEVAHLFNYVWLDIIRWKISIVKISLGTRYQLEIVHGFLPVPWVYVFIYTLFANRLYNIYKVKARYYVTF